MSKTGADIVCGGVGAFAIDFVAGKIYFRHHFHAEGVAVNLDGSSPSVYVLSGVAVPGYANIGYNSIFLPSPFRSAAETKRGGNKNRPCLRDR